MKRGFTVFELLVAACLVLVFMAFTFSYLDHALHDTQVMALRLELQGLRQSVQLYRMLKGNNPADLAALIKEGYILSMSERAPRPYFVASNISGRNIPVDPFGHEYQYDQSTGYVWSNTDGYQKL